MKKRRIRRKNETSVTHFLLFTRPRLRRRGDRDTNTHTTVVYTNTNKHTTVLHTQRQHTFCCLHDRDSAGEATATQTLILLSYTQTQTNILLSYIHKDNTLFVVYTTATTTVKKITLITVVCSTLYIRGIYARNGTVRILEIGD
jgi:hypothetical protein